MQTSHRYLDDGVFFGNRGYAPSPFLITPYTTTQNKAQEAYNNAHTKTRVIIEQTFARGKRRFHVLHGAIRMASQSFSNCRSLCSIAQHEEVDLLADVDPYYGPQQGLLIRDHICKTLFA